MDYKKILTIIGLGCIIIFTALIFASKHQATEIYSIPTESIRITGHNYNEIDGYDYLDAKINMETIKIKKVVTLAGDDYINAVKKQSILGIVYSIENKYLRLNEDSLVKLNNVDFENVLWN